MAVGLSQDAARSENQVSLERDRSHVSDILRARDHEFIPTDFPVEYIQYFQNIKDLEQYFPLEMKALPPLNQEPESRRARISLLRRYLLVKKAEESLGRKTPVAFFALHLCVGILAAIFLNSSNGLLGLIGALLSLLSVVLGNLKTVRRIIRFAEKRRSRRNT